MQIFLYFGYATIGRRRRPLSLAWRERRGDAEHNRPYFIRVNGMWINNMSSSSTTNRTGKDNQHERYGIHGYRTSPSTRRCMEDDRNMVAHNMNVEEISCCLRKRRPKDQKWYAWKWHHLLNFRRNGIFIRWRICAPNLWIFISCSSVPLIFSILPVSLHVS